VHEVPEKIHRLYRIFKTAVEDERKAQRLYQEALTMCEDPAVREAIQGLYTDEIRHEQEIIARYNDLRRRYTALAEENDSL